jgi:hypothetical protein
MKPNISHTIFIQACRKIGFELDKKDTLLGKVYSFTPTTKDIKYHLEANTNKPSTIDWFYSIFPPNDSWTIVAFRINYEFLTNTVYLAFVLQPHFGTKESWINKKAKLKMFMGLNDKTVDIGNMGLQSEKGLHYNFWKLKGSEVSINDFINNTEAVGVKYSDLILENFELIKSFLREGGIKVSSNKESLNYMFFSHTL